MREERRQKEEQRPQLVPHLQRRMFGLNDLGMLLVRPATEIDHNCHRVHYLASTGLGVNFQAGGPRLTVLRRFLVWAATRSPRSLTSAPSLWSSADARLRRPRSTGAGAR